MKKPSQMSMAELMARIPTESKPCKKLERARVALQIIHTWAKFRNGDAFNRTDVLRLVEKTLHAMK